MAFRTQKISQMTPKGSDLEATDLIEVSTIESGSYVTRSITGQELIDAIPAPTGFVPTSRTLTINGTTQDLSADRTFTISTGITIGTTLITSGTVGRVLFQGTGNVVSQSANLFWDNTNGRLGIGTSSPTRALSVNGDITSTDSYFTRSYALVSYTFNGNSQIAIYPAGTNILAFNTASLERIRIASTGNVLINTTTDAGFKLDVNGTARSTSFRLADSTFIASEYATGGTTLTILNGGHNLSVGVSSTSMTGIRGTALNGTGGASSTFSCGVHARQVQATIANPTIGLIAEGAIIGEKGVGVFNQYNTSSILQVDSTTKGFLKPRLTTTQKNAIASPAAGLEVYDTTLNRPCFYDGTTWITL